MEGAPTSDVRRLPVQPAEPDAGHDLLGALGAARFEADLELRVFHAFSPSVARLLGEAPERWMREPGLFHARLHPLDRALVAKRIEARAEHVTDARVFAADGRMLWMRLAAAPVRDAAGAPRGWRGVLLDVTAEKLNAAALAAQTEIALLLTRADDLEKAGEEILATLGRNLGCEMGALWLPGHDGALRCLAAWSAQGTTGFEAASRGMTFAPGVGLPGRVLASSRAAWVTDLAADGNFPRLGAAAAIGLRTGIAAPVVGATGARGVVELFSREPRAPDARVVAILEGVGVQIGQFMDRRAAERSARDVAARRGAVLETSLDAIVTMDASGTIVEFNPAAERTFGYTRDEAVGRPMVDLIVPPELRDAHRRGLERYLATGTPRVLGQRLQIHAMRKDKSLVPVELAIVRVPVEGPALFTGFLRDITEQKRAEEALRASEHRYSQILDSVTDMVFTKDARSSVTYANRATSSYYGVEAQQLRRLTDAQRASDTSGGAQREERRVFNEGRAVEVAEEATVRRDGETRIFHTIRAPIFDERGNVVEIVGVSRDVTDRKRAEQEAQRQSALLAAALDAVPDGILVVSSEGRILASNRRFAEMWAIPEDVLAMRDVRAAREAILSQVSDADAFEKRVQEIYAATGETTRDLLRLRDGRVFDRFSAPVPAADGGTHGRIWSFRDITDRKRAEETLSRLLVEVEDQRRRLDSIIASVPGVVWEAWGEPDASGQRINFVSEHVEKMLGYTREEWLATPNFWLAIVHPDDAREAAARARAAFESGQGGSQQFRWRRKDGAYVWVQAWNVVVRDANGKPIGMRGVTMDVTERRAAEAALRASEERLAAFYAGCPVALFTTTAEGRFLQANPAFARMMGYEDQTEFLGLPVPSLYVDPKARDQVIGILRREGAVHAFETQFRRLDGSVIWVSISARLARDADGGKERFEGALEDVTARKTSQTALARLAAIVQNTEDAIYGKSPDGVITEWNPGAERLYGYTREEILGKPIQTVVPPERVDEEQAILARVARGEGIAAFETVRVRKDGTRLDVSLTVSPIRDAEGRIVGASAIARDVTERKRASQMIAWQRHVLEKIASGAPLAETLDLLCREGEQQAPGRIYSVLLLEGSQLRHGAGPSLPAEYNRAIDGLRIGPGVGSCGTAAYEHVPVTVTDIASDARWKDFRELALGHGLRACWSTPILGARGDVLGTWAVYARQPGAPTAHDEAIVLTATRLAGVAIENRRAREELERVKHNLELILQSAGEGVYGVDQDGVTTFINQAGLRMLGLQEGDAVGRKLHGVIHHTRPDGRPYPATECPIYQAAHGAPGASVREEHFFRADGSILPVDYVTTPLTDNGRVIGAVTVFRDVTERRQAEAELRQRAEELARLAEQLQKSNRELDQFAYVTSHDLKAPLRGIANLSRWIEEDLGDKIGPDTREHLDLMRGRVHRMEALIDAILEYSRVGRVRQRAEPVDAGIMLKDVVDLLSPPPGFQVAVGEGMPTLVTERARLQQVFMNLIGNAIKHHPDKAHGRVEVGVEDAGAFWRFSVKDNGQGIAPRFHEKVFVIFQTLEARDKVEGTGIGLALVKKIVEGYGGQITLESDVGQGATFRFTWPKKM